MIKIEELNKLNDYYKKNKSNIVLNRMLNKVPLVELITDKDTKFDSNFNIEIKTHGIVNQNNSGRCWAFAGLNVLREEVIKKCNLEKFELSGSYIAFYDKIERFNKKMEDIIKYKNEGKDLYDKYISYILKNGIKDGGWFTGFANLVKKYGVVPNDIFPETYQSSNTYEVNEILSRLLRKFYLEIENAKDNIELVKKKYFEHAYKIITSVYGIPSESFDFEYVDKNGQYHIDKDLTPKMFYEKYIGLNLLDDYIEIGSYEDSKYKYGNVYEFECTSRMSEAHDLKLLNLKNDDVKKLIVKQLKSGELVPFYSSTTFKRVDGVWIDIMDRYSDIFNVNLRLENNDIIKTNARTGEHAMLFTGVKIKDNKTIKWKIENSWGISRGNNGDYIADDDWVDKYVYTAIINKKHLNKEQLEYLDKEVIKINKWDAKLD